MSDEKLYNIPFDGERPEPNVRDRDPTGFIDDLKLANQKLAEAQALIVAMKNQELQNNLMLEDRNARVHLLNEQNTILVEALKEINMRSMYGGEENTDELPSMNKMIGEMARKALEKVGVK